MVQIGAHQATTPAAEVKDRVAHAGGQRPEQWFRRAGRQPTEGLEQKKEQALARITYEPE